MFLYPFKLNLFAFWTVGRTSKTSFWTFHAFLTFTVKQLYNNDKVLTVGGERGGGGGPVHTFMVKHAANGVGVCLRLSACVI